MGKRSSVRWAGLSLVGLGAALLLAQSIDWDRMWPVFPLLGGLVFLGSYVASGFRDGGLAFIGTGATLSGLLFFGFSFGFWKWDEMARLWPLFPLIGGLS